MNRFISETEIEEAKKKREEEWEQARVAGRELPKEEPEDTRTLFERLQEQKDKKQEEFEEQLKFKNMIYKGLNEEDASFLSQVAKKQAEIDNKRFDDESEELQEYRTAVETTAVVTTSNEKQPPVKKKIIAADFFVKGKSQAALVASSIVRKRKSTGCSPTLNVKEKKVNPEEKLSAKAEASNSVTTDTTETIPTSLSILANYSSSSEDDIE